MPQYQTRENNLMERIRDGIDGQKHSVEFDYEQYRASVFNHLQDMFNVRQGSCLANPEYGLPDFNDLDMKYGFTMAVKEIIKSIKQNIATYEKGLKRVKVRFIKDEHSVLDIRFEIVGVLVVGQKSQRIKFETKRSSTGFLEVS